MGVSAVVLPNQIAREVNAGSGSSNGGLALPVDLPPRSHASLRLALSTSREQATSRLPFDASDEMLFDQKPSGQRGFGGGGLRVEGVNSQSKKPPAWSIMSALLCWSRFRCWLGFGRW